MYKRFYEWPALLPAIKRRRLEALKRRRKLWLKVHLWLGLGLGLILALIGLTGSVLVFWQEIDAALNPALFRASSPIAAKRKPLDEIFSAARQHAPPGWESGSTQAPEDGGNYVFNFYYATSSPPPESAQSFSVAVDPTSGHVAGTRVFYHAWNPLRHCFVGFFFKLHYALFLGQTGATLVGIIAVLLIVSALTGLILWWPLDGKWKRVLTIKPRASAVRFNHDLHQTAGFYSVLVLLALLVSGLYFNLGEEFRWLVERFSPLTPEPAATPLPAENRIPTPLDKALAEARQRYPSGKVQYYAFSNRLNSPWEVCSIDVPELRKYVLDTRCLLIDTVSGKVLQVKDAAHGSAGDVFMQWQWPLHSGRAFGWTGRMLVFITGLVCPVLFVTGLIRWLQKRRAEEQKTKRAEMLH